MILTYGVDGTPMLELIVVTFGMGDVWEGINKIKVNPGYPITLLSADRIAHMR